MNQTIKRILIVIVIALLAFGIVLIVYDNFGEKAIEADNANANVLNNANEGLGNLVASTETNENTENVKENENNEISDVKNETQASNKNDNEYDLDTTEGEKLALKLAKEEWKNKKGNLDGVLFSNEMRQGDGKYVVIVSDSKTTTTIKFYVVDVVTGLVEER